MGNINNPLLNVQPPAQSPTTASNQQTREETEYLVKQRREDLLNRQLEQDIDERKMYAQLIFVLIVGWIVAILAVVLLQGFSFKGFEISDKVLMTLIGGTTINILGIFIIVANYLFPRFCLKSKL